MAGEEDKENKADAATTGTYTIIHYADCHVGRGILFLSKLYYCGISKILWKKGGVPDLYFIFDMSISCNNLAKTWNRTLEFGI